MHAEFITSAANVEGFPDTDLPEFAFVGRSNVGKSSLLNKLAGANIARTSKTPGRTQLVNFFKVSGADFSFMLADLPGYGFARAPRPVRRAWYKLLEVYLSEREPLRAEINVGPSFYNLWMVPVGLLLLALTGIGPLLSWRKSTAKTILNQFIGPAMVGLLTMAGGIALSIYVYGSSEFFVPAGSFYLPSGEGYSVITFGLCGFVTATIFQEFWRGTKIRSKNSGEDMMSAFVSLTSKAKRRYGGYVVHFGVMLMFVGFAGEAFKEEKQQILAMGERTQINNYDVQLDQLVFADDGQKNSVTAHLALFRTGTNDKLDTLTPAKWFYRKPEEQVTTEVDKYLSVAGDVYLVLGAYDAKAQTASLQLKFNPLVNFVWLGCAFLMFGFGIATWPSTSKSEEVVPRRSWFRLSAGWASFLLSVLALVLSVS